MAVQDDVLDIYEQMIHSTPKFAKILHGVIPPKYHYEDGLTINNKVLHLSYNKFVGRIPKGNQIQTFPAECFQGNEGLCDPPLTINCTYDVAPETHDEAKHSNSGSEIQWDLISVEVGFVVGLGSVIGPLVFSRKWRKRFFDGLEDIASRMLPWSILERWLAWKTEVGK
ncbi:hypothetical protein FEM48_Zijuj05G0087200 [Ziziphus jujuba var. spinosa]|uniref:Receptor-like protein kinase n=1 Tax=Ziziphus jujuba var. spinosa TaxID=714518 RepID=A0A978VDZ2_ZIZJJ|nr:hypothetical protein FEM48_Zijuj05G0087200 [Ziziphus jujuba var. spinosa]